MKGDNRGTGLAVFEIFFFIVSLFVALLKILNLPLENSWNFVQPQLYEPWTAEELQETVLRLLKNNNVSQKSARQFRISA